MLLLMNFTIHTLLKVAQNLHKNQRRVTRNIIRINRTISTFADDKRKTGIGPSLASKDRGTSIRKTNYEL